MAYLGDGAYEALGHHELMMLRDDGTYDVWCYGYQPTTQDIGECQMGKYGAKQHGKYTLCVQKIGDVYEVYDLKTLTKNQFTGWSIGLPVATHENVDAAIMAAVLLA
jgi:hypothetical protein